MLRTTIVVAALFAVAAAVPIVDRDLLPVIDHSKINEINSMQVCFAPPLHSPLPHNTPPPLPPTPSPPRRSRPGLPVSTKDSLA